MKKYIILIIFPVLLIAIYVPSRLFKPIITKARFSNMKLTSPAFSNNHKLPIKYTCEGDGTSPELIIDDVPKKAQSLALILKDPDSPGNTFIHYVVWNISKDTQIIPENATPSGSVVGINNIGKNYYFSPCPHQGKHRYVFYLFALDTTLTLPKEAGAKDLEQIIMGHILDSTTLTGVFP